MKKRASYSRPFILPHSSSQTLPGTLQRNISSSRDRLNVRAHFNSSPGSLGAVSVARRKGAGEASSYRIMAPVEMYGKTAGKGC